MIGKMYNFLYCCLVILLGSVMVTTFSYCLFCLNLTVIQIWLALFLNRPWGVKKYRLLSAVVH